MKLSQRRTELEKVMHVLDAIGIQYGRAKIEAKDNETGKAIQTEVILGSFVFHADSGKYLFSGPVAPPAVGAGPNHKPS
jgi:hypothetical protein